MIETLMLIALGFTAASLLALLIAPAVWARAVRLTTRKIEATMPISPADINADKDLVRAEYAVELRRLELALEQAKERAARHLMERNLHTVEIGKLEAEIAALKDAVSERTTAGSVLEQTVQKRIPGLEQQIAEARAVIAARELELAERANAYANQGEALELAQSMIRRQEKEIDRLRESLEGGGISRLVRWGRGGADDERHAALAQENGKLHAELSRLRENLAQLKEVDGHDMGELRAEMHRLADLMLNGKASAASRAKATRAKARQAEARKDAAGKQAGGGKAETASKPGASSRKSLSERLSGLTRRKVKASA